MDLTNDLNRMRNTKNVNWLRRTSFGLIALLCIQQIFLVINDLLTFENSLNGHSLGVHSTLIFFLVNQ